MDQHEYIIYNFCFVCKISICYYMSGSTISVMLHEGLMLTLGLRPQVNINPRNRPRTRGKISTIVFLSQETIREKALHLDRLFHREWSRKQCAEGAYPLWSDMHCNSRLVTNLVPFWRVVTRQFTVHCYLSEHTWCAT